MKDFIRFNLMYVMCFIMTHTFSHTSFGQSLPLPLIKVHFNDPSTSATAVANAGTATFQLSRSEPFPASSVNVPAGVGGASSLDFGTTPGYYYVQGEVIDALKNLSAFTLTGWINTKSSTTGSGGNRIISWINNGGDGVDLVYQSNGSLRLGVDGWPDSSPAFSSVNRVPANASAPATNWVFFAVTYQSNGQVQFYFGNNTANASLDVVRTYAGRGNTGSNISRLAIGAFNDATLNPSTQDRMFRGLVDDIQVYSSVLSLSNIITVQREGDITPPTTPVLHAPQGKTATTINLYWDPSADDVGVSSYNVYNGNEIIASTPGSQTTLGNLTPGTTYSVSIRAVDAAGNSSGPSHTATITTDGDTTPPTSPTVLRLASKTATTVNLEWIGSTDNIGVSKYDVYNGAQIIASSPGTQTTLGNLTPGTTYSLTVQAVDAAGNSSGPSNRLTVTTEMQSLPLIALNFNESSGTSVNNSGASSASFARSANVPASSANAPTGVGGPGSFDFGTVSGNYYVQSGAPIDALKNLSAFTLTGWLNCKSNVAGSGGNRIISWINNGGDGVDLVYQSNGSLRLGVNSWPDNSPAFSSANKIPTNASSPATNWVFFAVTYQFPGNIKFYFGGNNADATLDVTLPYGTVVTGSNIGKLAIGAFNDATRNSNTYNRMFRGLIDNVQIHGSALSLADIITVQRGGVDTTPPTSPTVLRLASKTATTLNLEWIGSTDNIGVSKYDVYNGTQVIASSPGTQTTLGNLAPGTTYSLTVQAVDAAGNSSGPSNRLTVTTEMQSLPLIALNFNESSGTSVNNSGASNASFARSANVPASSANAPTGVGGPGSFDFGTVSGNYYVQSGAPIDALKNLSAFTLTGWLNCKSNVAGSGGNRIISWINNGGDGVDLVYQSNGSLRLGVNSWPDNSPAFSSANKIPTNASSPATNWVFFAVTYQFPGNIKFYFGGNNADATLDVTLPYGTVVTGSNIGKLAIGAFNDATRNSTTYDRMFKGLIDDVRIFGSALDVTSIVAVQRGVSSASGTSSSARVAISIDEEIHTSLDEGESEVYQNYPNPFNTNTQIEMYVPHSIKVARVVVNDVSGRALSNIEVLGRGKTGITIEGSSINVGLYFYSLIVDGKVVGIKRMAITK